MNTKFILLEIYQKKRKWSFYSSLQETVLVGVEESQIGLGMHEPQKGMVENTCAYWFSPSFL